MKEIKLMFTTILSILVMFAVTLLILSISGCSDNVVNQDTSVVKSLSNSSICQQLNMEIYDDCGYMYEEFNYDATMETPTTIYNDNSDIYSICVHYANEDNEWKGLILNVNTNESVEYAKTLVGKDVELCQMVYYANGEEIGNVWYIENWGIENDIPICDSVYPYYLSHSLD